MVAIAEHRVPMVASRSIFALTAPAANDCVQEAPSLAAVAAGTTGQPGPRETRDDAAGWSSGHAGCRQRFPGGYVNQ
jgi:hypothetical protein